MNDLLVPVTIGCLVALASGAWVVGARTLVHAVVALLAHSLSLAGLYMLLSADFVAMSQVLIYAGAIVVLFLFVVALLPSGGLEFSAGSGRLLAGVVAGLTLLVALAAATAVGVPVAKAAQGLDIRAVGRSLFGPLIVPFELTAPLLLVAIVGAVAIWRRQEPYRDQTHPGSGS